MTRAERRVLNIKIGFVAAFAVIVAGVWWYQLSVARPKAVCLARPGGQWEPKTRACKVTPESACEAGGGWWDPKDGICAKVVSIPSITGRK